MGIIFSWHVHELDSLSHFSCPVVCDDDDRRVVTFLLLVVLKSLNVSFHEKVSHDSLFKQTSCESEVESSLI